MGKLIRCRGILYYTILYYTTLYYTTLYYSLPFNTVGHDSVYATQATSIHKKMISRFGDRGARTNAEAPRGWDQWKLPPSMQRPNVAKLKDTILYYTIRWDIISCQAGQVHLLEYNNELLLVIIHVHHVR